MRDYSINLGFFTGPMDLLLHLVQQQEVAVEEVEMADVSEQYLEIVLESRWLDMDKASEFLVIAATLLSIKSQKLLPAEPSVEEDSGWEDSEFLEELREQLRVYEVTKRRAEALRDTPQFGVDTFSRKDREALTPDPEELAEGSEPGQLGELFHALLKRVGAGLSRMSIRLEPISVMRYMMKSIDVLKTKAAPRSFFALAHRFMSEPSEAELSPRGVIIGSFVSTLELVRRGLLKVSPATSGDYELQLALIVDEDVNEKVIAMEDYREDVRKEVNLA